MQRGTIQTLMQLQLKGLLMRTIILYASRHHGNTKKLVDAIVEAHPEIDTLDVKSLGKNEYPDLHEYHLIGVATGIYYSEIDKDMARVLTNVLQPQDKVFGLMTYGGKNKWYGKGIKPAYPYPGEDECEKMRSEVADILKDQSESEAFLTTFTKHD